MALSHRIRPKYRNHNEQVVAELREAAGAAAPLDPKIVIKRKTAEVATVMALLHGGDWRVQIDHERGFVFVTRRLDG